MRCATGRCYVPSFFNNKAAAWGGLPCSTPYSPPYQQFSRCFREVQTPGKTLSESSKTFGVFCGNPLVFFFFLTPAECFVGLAENDKLCFFLFFSSRCRPPPRTTPKNPDVPHHLLTIPRVLNKMNQNAQSDSTIQGRG